MAQAQGWNDQAFSPCGGRPPPESRMGFLRGGGRGGGPSGKGEEASMLQFLISPGTHSVMSCQPKEVLWDTLWMGEGRPVEERAYSDGRESGSHLGKWVANTGV